MLQVADPRHADAGRAETFRALLRSRGAAYAIVLGAAAAVVYGAYRGSAVILLGGPVAVLALVAGWCAIRADRLAAMRFFAAFAARHGLHYAGRWELLPLTPLLGAGERRWCEHWMSGEICEQPSLSGGLGHLVYERRARWAGREAGIERAHEVGHERRRLTVAMVDIERSLPLFHGLFVHPRSGLLDGFEDWLDHPAARETEVESAAFTGRYRLRIADEQDELLARQLLSPSLVEWLARHPLQPGLELRAGTLVVFCRRVLEDAGNLTLFLEAVRELAQRVVREVREAEARAAGARG